VIEDIMQPLVH
jgi:hypothetical protein